MKIKTFCLALAAVVFVYVNFASLVLAMDLNGLWTKTTSPDPNNITIIYNEKNSFKAIGYSEIQGKKIVWYAEGEMEGKRLQCFYHYSQDALPPGWESEGIMKLHLSDDGNVITGTATSKSGNWSGTVEFKRVQLVSPSVK